MIAATKEPEEIRAYLNAQNRKTVELVRAFESKDKEILSAFDEVRMIEAEADIEGTKLIVDAVKQQATFSAASIAGITAVTVGILPDNLRLVWLFGITIGILLLTIISSGALLFIEGVRIRAMLQTGQAPDRENIGMKPKGYLYWSVLGFPAAAVTFVIFLLVNLYS